MRGVKNMCGWGRLPSLLKWGGAGEETSGNNSLCISTLGSREVGEIGKD